MQCVEPIIAKMTGKFVESTKLTKNPLPALKHESICSTIGATPLVKLNRMAPAGVTVYVKAEAFNPMGSVKDRLALGMIEYAEAHGLLKPGQTVIEATSGNTGLGLAMVCASKGYPFISVMSEAFSIERRKMMRFLGAKVVLTNPAHKFGGMLQTLMALKVRTARACASCTCTDAGAQASSSRGLPVMRAGEARLLLAQPV